MRTSVGLILPMLATPLFAATVSVLPENVKLPVIMSAGGGGSVVSAAASETALATTTATPQIVISGGETAAASLEEGGEDAAVGSTTGRRASLPEYQQRKINRTKKKTSVTVAPPAPGPVTDPDAGMMPVAPPSFVLDDPSPLIWRVEGGYQSAYVYHGLDQVQLAAWNLISVGGLAGGSASATRDTGIWYLGAGVQFQGFSFSFKHLQSLEKFNPLYVPTVTTPEKYEEILVDLNYTLGILNGGLLDATVGAELRYFDQESWWNTDMISNIYFQLKSSKNPLVRPSLTYYYKDAGDVGADFTTNTHTAIVAGDEIVSGQEIVAKVDGELTIGQFGPVTIGAGYYAEIGYYMDNLGAKSLDGIGHYGGGVSFPVSVGGVTVSPGVHYHDNDFATIDRTDIFGWGTANPVPEFWWGVNASFSF